jgi:integrase/recombinase XerD
MRVRLDRGKTPSLIDDGGEEISVVGAFMRGVLARGCSPNTAAAYAYDLKRFYEFLAAAGLSIDDFTVARSVDFIVHLRGLIVVRGSARGRALAPATINRSLAAVSMFYEHLVLTDAIEAGSSPLEASRRRQTPGSFRRPAHRNMRMKRVERLPRPLQEDQVTALLKAANSRRDLAIMLLMLQGGLRIGEVLNLRLEDIQYGRRRIIVRHAADHPKGVRTKSRSERVVDLLEPDTLLAVSAYVVHERPKVEGSAFLFLAGGYGATRGEPLGYAAVAKWFKRRAQAAGLTSAWITAHALRHTHATRMWEGGMSELGLQKRLGHASFESTRGYTRVSDAAMLADYKKALKHLECST